MYVSTNVYSVLTSRASRSNENVEIGARRRKIHSFYVYSTIPILPLIRKLRHEKGVRLSARDAKFSSPFHFRGDDETLQAFTGVLNVNAGTFPK